MADKKVENPNNPENGEPKDGEIKETTELTTQKKGGAGTMIKIGAGLLFGAAFTGLGWLLRGVFGGHGDDGDETETDQAETPEE